MTDYTARKLNVSNMKLHTCVSEWQPCALVQCRADMSVTTPLCLLTNRRWTETVAARFCTADKWTQFITIEIQINSSSSSSSPPPATVVNLKPAYGPVQQLFCSPLINDNLDELVPETMIHINPCYHHYPPQYLWSVVSIYYEPTHLPYLTSTSALVILDLMWLLFGCWDSLVPASHCVTTSWLVTDTSWLTASSSSHRREQELSQWLPGFYVGCSSCHNNPYFQAGDRHRICWLAYAWLGYCTL